MLHPISGINYLLLSVNLIPVSLILTHLLSHPLPPLIHPSPSNSLTLSPEKTNYTREYHE